MKFIKYTPEGARTNEAFINWETSPASRLRVIVSFFKFHIYFRWRSQRVGGKRIIFEIRKSGELV